LQSFCFLVFRLLIRVLALLGLTDRITYLLVLTVHGSWLASLPLTTDR